MVTFAQMEKPGVSSDEICLSCVCGRYTTKSSTYDKLEAVYQHINKSLDDDEHQTKALFDFWEVARDVEWVAEQNRIKSYWPFTSRGW